MHESQQDKQAHQYVASYINGNRTSTCCAILTGDSPSVMASLVTLGLARITGLRTAEEFIRILVGQTPH